MRWPNSYHGRDDRQRRVRLAPSPWGIWGPRLIVLLVALIIASFTLVTWTDVPAMVLGISPILLVIMLTVELTRRHERFGRLVARRTASGHCPQCLYPLRNGPRSDDLATICPECGAAWVLPGKAKKG